VNLGNEAIYCIASAVSSNVDLLLKVPTVMSWAVSKSGGDNPQVTASWRLLRVFV